MENTKKTWLGEHWLVLLMAAQPLLDALAYFTQNKNGTAAGYIRLGLLLLLPLIVLAKSERKKPWLLGYAIIGAFCLLHVLNGFRVGYRSLSYDLAYMVRVAQTPVLALSFIWYLQRQEARGQAWRGILTAAVIMAVSVPVAWLTGTGNVTYGEGLGYSGWVIDDNRCANSILLVTLSTFAVGYAVRTEKRWLSLLIPCVVTVLFLTNGTKACYFSVFAIFGAYTAYLLAEKLLLKKKLKTLLLFLLIFLMIFSVVIYPWTPRCRVNQEMAKKNTQGEIEATLLEKGIDVTKMSFEERYNDPVVREVFEYYYWQYMGGLPDLIDRFGMDRVLRLYRMTTDVGRLIDTRVIERSYARLIWEVETDSLTKFVGFEAAQVGTDGVYDMENDWPALFFYYGYVGFALYVGFVLAFLLRILRRLKEDFKGSCTVENFTLALVLALQLGLAQFSGALVRRPNVSIYFALILALIWYQTGRKERNA